MKGRFVTAALAAVVSGVAASHNHHHVVRHDDAAHARVLLTKTLYVTQCPCTHPGLPMSTSTTNSTFTPVPPHPADQSSTSALPAQDKPSSTTPAQDKPAPTTTPAQDKPAPTTTPAQDKPAPTTPAQDKPAPTTPAQDKPAPTTPAQDKPAPTTPTEQEPAATTSNDVAKPQPTKSGDSSGHKLSSDNDHFGITYTPFEPASGACKGPEEIEADIAIISSAGFTTVRIYSPECKSLIHVGNACKKHGLSLIVGVFVKASGCDANTPDVKLQIDELVAWDNWGVVSLVVVGNEAIMNGYCTPQQLRDLVVSVKVQVKSKYSGLFTISETLNVWLRHEVSSVICPVIPITGANIHSFFNSAIAAPMSGVFVKGQMDILASICPGNDVINLECGYPSVGKTNGLAVAGPSQQLEAITAIRKLVGHKTVFFSFQNDLWKGQSACECEVGFGLADIFGMKVSYD